ncbi:DUF2141 domain-containing protein [Bradyrhizobium sp. GCM10027634]|uniref:DUF2141 domain-containing protein n=1 Tax=unclassified Bradyrhizobium TaxID=2631580 RepID=UPI00188C488B|nr:MULTISPECIES: DUF2141 domain-containing protein [unclassified Bradyrhizobium]MDN5001678.1 DUF2141 domain-containing protein [Bradyrhizobium sp. WYCCWR 12677]
MARAASALLAAMLLAPTALQPSLAGDTESLSVRATGFSNSRGHAVAKLFGPGDTVTGRGRWQVSATIARGVATFEFGRMPSGDYAAVVFHDENDNAVIDHNVLGVPSEALGFSNGFRLGLTSGMPTFEKLRFRHGARPEVIDITVQ